MKKLYFLMTLVFLAAVPFLGTAQNMVVNGDLEIWEGGAPASWDVTDNITQESTTVHGGDYSAAQMSSADGSQKFRQDVVGVVGGQQYTIRYYFLDNVDNAKTRVWSYWLDADGGYLDADQEVLRPSEYSENSADWQEYEVVLTAPADANQFRFEVRVYHQEDNVGGNVYYDDFFMSGEQTNYPEPTNYPTEFMAEGSGITIDVSWMDAVGDQLPTAYLVLGEMLITTNADLEVPVDGVPVADDLNWDDMQVSVNVGYGQEMYLFNDLEAGASYQFIIYPYTNSGENIDYKTDGTAPVATAQLENIVTISFQDFEDGSLAPWTQYSVVGAQVWEPYEFSGDNFARVSGYDGTSNDNEDWLISPDLGMANMFDVKFSFISAYNYEGNALELYVSQDYDGSGNPNDFNWVDLTGMVTWSEGSWAWTESGEIDIAEYYGPGTYLAFKYTSTTEGSSTWEVDNLFVYGTSGVGVFEKQIENLTVYPNPASEAIHFNVKENGDLNIYNLAGQQILSKEVQAGNQEINISNLHNGLYIVRFIGDNNLVATTKLTIN